MVPELNRKESQWGESHESCGVLLRTAVFVMDGSVCSGKLSLPKMTQLTSALRDWSSQMMAEAQKYPGFSTLFSPVEENAHSSVGSPSCRCGMCWENTHFSLS